jgi:hypothetical protein
MSLLWLLRKFVDPIQELRRKREAIPPDVDPDLIDNPVLPPPKADTRRFRCRVCAHESSDGSYCPSCLADTMKPIVSSR